MPAGDAGWRSENGSRGRWLVTAAPGRLRECTPGRHDDRSARSSLDWDRKERVTPVKLTHDLVGKPVTTFPDHALNSARSFEPGRSNIWDRAPRPSPRKRVSGVELWRSVAAASAVVERRQASVPPPNPPPQAGEEKRQRARAASQDADGRITRLSAFCFLFFFRRYCERSEAIQCGGSVTLDNEASVHCPAGLLRRFAPRNDGLEMAWHSSGALRVARRDSIYLSPRAGRGRVQRG